MADYLGRDSILIEQSPEYCRMAAARIRAGLGRVDGIVQSEPDLPLFEGARVRTAQHLAAGEAR